MYEGFSGSRFWGVLGFKVLGFGNWGFLLLAASFS